MFQLSEFKTLQRFQGLFKPVPFCTSKWWIRFHFWFTVLLHAPTNIVVFPHQWVVFIHDFSNQSIAWISIFSVANILGSNATLIVVTCIQLKKIMTSISSINIIQYWHQSTINYLYNAHDICVQYPGNPGPANACHGFQMFPGTWCWAPPC